MKELLEEIISWFVDEQSPQCQCGFCIKAREWIKKIKKELKNES